MALTPSKIRPKSAAAELGEAIRYGRMMVGQRLMG